MNSSFLTQLVCSPCVRENGHFESHLPGFPLSIGRSADNLGHMVQCYVVLCQLCSLGGAYARGKELQICSHMFCWTCRLQ